MRQPGLALGPSTSLSAVFFSRPLPFPTEFSAQHQGLCFLNIDHQCFYPPLFSLLHINLLFKQAPSVHPQRCHRAEKRLANWPPNWSNDKPLSGEDYRTNGKTLCTRPILLANHLSPLNHQVRLNPMIDNTTLAVLIPTTFPANVYVPRNYTTVADGHSLTDSSLGPTKRGREHGDKDRRRW